MALQSLQAYRVPLDWLRGHIFLRLAWFLFGKPLLASWIPGSAWRKFLLQVFRAKLGKRLRLKPRLHITSPWMLYAGDDCWFGEDLWIDNPAPVYIGNNVCLSQGAYLCTGNHDYRKITFDLRLGPISIGNSVWIAAKAVLAPGAKVGEGAVVAIGSVVNGYVPPSSIMKGNPAVQVGTR